MHTTPTSQAVRAAVWQALFQMEMEKWHWRSEASTEAKRKAHSALKTLLATLPAQALAQPVQPAPQPEKTK